MSRDGYLPPGIRQSDIDRHLDGSAYGYEPPQVIVTCPTCDGKGCTVHRIRVYEHGCGFAHDDSEERPCETCGGAGELIEDADGRSIEDTYCDLAECPGFGPGHPCPACAHQPDAPAMEVGEA